MLTLDTYDRQASWVGPRYKPQTRVVMVVVSDRQDFLDGRSERGAPADGSTLVISVDQAEGSERTAAAVVSCYRWLLAQLVEPQDVLIVGGSEFAEVMQLVARQLLNSGDPLPAATMITDQFARNDALPTTS